MLIYSKIIGSNLNSTNNNIPYFKHLNLDKIVTHLLLQMRKRKVFTFVFILKSIFYYKQLIQTNYNYYHNQWSVLFAKFSIFVYKLVLYGSPFLDSFLFWSVFQMMNILVTFLLLLIMIRMIIITYIIILNDI